jgi:hypothetical protein
MEDVMAPKKRSGTAALRRDVNALKRDVAEVKQATAIPVEQRMNMAQMPREARPGERADYLTTTRGNANYETPVAEHLGRLQGRSTSGTVSDRDRRADSPLGGGTHSRERRR